MRGREAMGRVGVYEEYGLVGLSLRGERRLEISVGRLAYGHDEELKGAHYGDEIPGLGK